MTDLAATDELFFTRAGLGRGRVQDIVDDALNGADDGELFLEYRQSESLVFDDGQVKSASFDTTQGFGLRAISGERCPARPCLLPVADPHAIRAFPA